MTILRRTSTKVVVEFGVPPTPAVPDRVVRRLIRTETSTQVNNGSITFSRNEIKVTPPPPKKSPPPPPRKKLMLTEAAKRKYALKDLSPKLSATTKRELIELDGQPGGGAFLDAWTKPVVSAELYSKIETMQVPILATILPYRLKNTSSNRYFVVDYTGTTEKLLEENGVYTSNARSQSHLVGRVCLFDFAKWFLSEPFEYIPLFVDKYKLPAVTRYARAAQYPVYGFRLGLAGYRPAKWGAFSQVGAFLTDLFPGTAGYKDMGLYDHYSGAYGLDKTPHFNWASKSHGVAGNFYFNAALASPILK